MYIAVSSVDVNCFIIDVINLSHILDRILSVSCPLGLHDTLTSCFSGDRMHAILIKWLSDLWVSKYIIAGTSASQFGNKMIWTRCA